MEVHINTKSLACGPPVYTVLWFQSYGSTYYIVISTYIVYSDLIIVYSDRMRKHTDLYWGQEVIAMLNLLTYRITASIIFIRIIVIYLLSAWCMESIAWGETLLKPVLLSHTWICPVYLRTDHYLFPNDKIFKPCS